MRRLTQPHQLRALAPLAVALLATSLAACGDDGDEPTPEEVSQSAPAADAFPPAPKGTLDDLLQVAEPTDEIVASPAGAVFTQGDNRFGFGVFDVGGEQITDAEVAIYAAPGPDGEPTGPHPASIEGLETEPAFEARTTADDPQSAETVYVTDISFDQPGEWRLVALVRDGENFLATRLPSIEVGDYAEIPDVGEKAPIISTPTTEDVGDLSEIDTRDPHDSMHEVDAEQVIGEKPTVLLFATPALCASRVCGPVVDVAEQVKSELGDEAEFIHMEVFEDNNPTKGVREQLQAYGLRTEPWLFVLDAEGRVSTRIEGAFSAAELRQAVEKAS